MTLTVKHTPANAAQVKNLTLLCQIAKSMGANKSQMAGAMATMIQESAAVNMQGGDRDSAGLFQQRPSVGAWGTYAQVTDPVHACKAFLNPYLNYCRRGTSPIAASNLVQRSAFPTAPAQWYSESFANVTQILSGSDLSDATASGLSLTTTTRSRPYEFSRGNAGQREDSWSCITRLAQEVSWDAFMRSGTLWFASETWLANQPPRFLISQGTRGVISVTFNADSRRNAAEMTVTAKAKRWSVLPGDVVLVNGQGPGDGVWLVSDTRRSLWDDTTEIQLKRAAAPKKEPAQEQNTTTKVSGIAANGLAGYSGSAPAKAQAVYAAAQTMSAMHIPYSISARTLVASPPSADCSSSCSWALLKAGFPLPGGISWGGWAPVSGQFESWGVGGEGKYFTVWCSGEHIWLRFHGFPMWRFDTSPHGDGPSGPQLRKTPRSTDTFMARHWPGL